ncbi:hypothetical protein, partial [Intestinimonas sp. HCP28S3_D6]|uniref:hypothetical protein n=1 Tax=Intestinimonas sp. HCP28S3_D6 TaxID=3438942 RepID=UPI003F8AA807
ALPWKKLCANFILPCGENHYGFFLRCPTSFYNRPKILVEADFISDLSLLFVNPCIRSIREYFILQEALNASFIITI